jgi:sulfonate transport system permease protein
MWEFATDAKWLPPSQSAAPSKVIQQMVALLKSQMLAWQALYSLMRLSIGVLLGTVAGISSGVFMSQSERADKFVSPTMQFLAPIPVIVWIPFVIMFFGLGEVSKIALVAVAVFFLIHIHTFQAIRSVETQYVELSRVYEKNYWGRVRHVYLPSATPSILTALRISLALGWIALFLVEYAFSTPKEGGLGWFIADARALGRVEDQFAGVVLLGIIGFAFDRSILYLQRRRLAWSDSLETSLLKKLI